MIKLTVLVKRNPSLSVDEFHEKWRIHGRMIADEPAFRKHIKRYEQHHSVDADQPYDGLVLQWFDDYDGFLGFLREPQYMEKVRPDETALLDMDGLVVMFTDEAETFIP
jgi:hypothetical protein